MKSCGNCKYEEYRKEYLYPCWCKKEKAVSYSEEKWADRVRSGYVCKKWEPKKGCGEDGRKNSAEKRTQRN